MKIGYAVEGSTDRALLAGLRKRWCPDAELIEGLYKGTGRGALLRQLHRIADILFHKGCEVLVFLCDADDDAWREVRRLGNERIPQALQVFTTCGVADRNIECWLCADPQYVAQQTGRDPKEFEVDDPKGPFESAMSISRDDRKEKEIAGFVVTAPLDRWLKNSRSFEDFFDQLWRVSKQRDCEIENLRESSRA